MSKNSWQYPIIGLVICVLLTGAVYFHAQVSEAVITAGTRCLVSVLPSLYFFSILASFCVKSGLLEALAKPFQKPCRKLLHTDAMLVIIVLFSQIGGYPAGAQLVHNLYQERRISEQQEQNLICVCMGCGFGFLLAAVGGSSALFVWLMMSIPNLLLALFVIRNLFLTNAENQIHKPFAVCMTESVESTASAMLRIMAMIVAFSAVMGMAEAMFPNPGDFVRSVLEISHASAFVRHGGSLAVTAGLLSFGGICVHLQIAAVCENHISWLKFWLCRILTACMTYWLCLLFMSRIPGQMPVFLSEMGLSPRETSSLSVIPGCCLVLMSVLVLKKYHFFQKSLTNAKK